MIRLQETIDVFKGFLVGSQELVVSHLQYVVDTMFIGELLAKNLYYLKTILWSFELAFGLGVNLYKSSVWGQC